MYEFSEPQEEAAYPIPFDTAPSHQEPQELAIVPTEHSDSPQQPSWPVEQSIVAADERRGDRTRDDGDTPEPPPPTHMEVPEEIQHILETGEGIIESGLPGATTNKYFLRDHPDLLIRSPADHCDPEELTNANEAGKALRDHGVNVLPSVVVPFGEGSSVVTKRVDGIDLETALRESPSEKLIQTVDTTWKGVCDYAVHCALNNENYADDIDNAGQYMVGTMAGDTVERLWLVDLPSSVVSLDPALTGRARDEYQRQLLHIAKGIREIEALSGHRLAAARAAMDRAQSFARDSEQYGDGLRVAAYRVLDHGEDIVEVDAAGHAYIQQLRTR